MPIEDVPVAVVLKVNTADKTVSKHKCDVFDVAMTFGQRLVETETEMLLEG